MIQYLEKSCIKSSFSPEYQLSIITKNIIFLLDIQMPYAQRLTNTYTTTTAPGTFLFSDTNISTWYSTRKTYINKVGNIYVVNTALAPSFASIIDGTTPVTAAPLVPTGTTPGINTSVRDLGKEIRIGISTEASLLVLRLVQIPGPSASNGVQGDASNAFGTGWIVVENNCSDTFTNPTNFLVRAARV